MTTEQRTKDYRAMTEYLKKTLPPVQQTAHYQIERVCQVLQEVYSRPLPLPPGAQDALEYWLYRQADSALRHQLRHALRSQRRYLKGRADTRQAQRSRSRTAFQRGYTQGFQDAAALDRKAD